MADDWYYAQGGERQGPVPLGKLVQLARGGWIVPDTLVWRPGMAGWLPAGDVPELQGGSIGRSLKAAIDGIVPLPDVGPRQRPPRRPAEPVIDVDWGDLRPRHLLAAMGAFIAALGIAFTVIGGTRLSLAFTLGGLALATAGMHVEVGRLLAQAAANVARASREAAERRHEARKLALENRRLELEAERLARAEAAARPMPPPVPPAAPTEAAPAGRTIVITHPPVRRWSPGLAVVLSFFLPGLGQLYKGQVFNGIVWFFLVGLGYAALVLPGLLLHFCCILGAASGNPWAEGRTEIVQG